MWVLVYINSFNLSLKFQLLLCLVIYRLRNELFIMTSIQGILI